MSLQFIFGCSGSGKTKFCYDQIIEASKQDTSKTLIMIVPEQFTLETQKDIVQLHPASGIMHIEVLSFQRLAYRIMDELGGGHGVLLGKTGIGMVIRKVIENHKEQLTYFDKNCEKAGFVKELKSLITELYQYDISPETLNKSLEVVEERPLLHSKLSDLQVVYEGFKAYIKEKYMTTEESLDILSASVGESKLLANATLWIDGFYGFTPIQYKVLHEMLKKVKDTYMTLTVDQIQNMDDLSDESELFYESKKTYNKLMKIAEQEKVKVKDNIFLNKGIPHRFNHMSLAHLEKNIFRYPYKIYTQDVEGIYLYSAPHIRKEVAHISSCITALVRDEGYRFRDIGVVTGDLEGYEKVIGKSFMTYDIPFFIDKKKDIMTHPMVELIRSALEIIYRGYTYETIFRYAKTQLVNIPLNDLDILENYVLAYGIKGRKKWENPFEYPFKMDGDNDEYATMQLQRINDAREKIMKPLAVFHDAVKGKSDVRTITEALYHLLTGLHIEQQMLELSRTFKEQKELLLEKEYQSIYKVVMTLLDNIVDILGDEVMVLQEYATILESGLSQCEMGLVPPGLDQVVVGDFERSRMHEVKALFILGLNEGKIPKTSIKANILSDTDKDELQKNGVELAPTGRKKAFEEQFLIYMGLTKPSEKLYLSFARTDMEGKSMRPSILISRVRKIFRHLKMVDIETLKEEALMMPQKPTFKKLLEKLRDYETYGLNDYWKDIYSWFYRHEKWQTSVHAAVRSLYHLNAEDPLPEELVRSIYSDILINSVSRLEAFAKCPFAHFLDYGLEVEERRVREISMPDIGILFHRSIDVFSKKVHNRQLEWGQLEDGIRDQLVEETVYEVAEKYANSIFYSTSRNTYLIRRLTRITKRAIWALQYHIRKGEFEPTDYEVAFSADKAELATLKIDFDDERTMKLKGRIDRVDKYEDDDTVYVKVIDYKSGNKKFDITALYYGLQLQLLVYLNAVTELEHQKTTKQVIPAGVFYYHIDDPIIKADGELSMDMLEAHILKSLKMNGLVLNDLQIIEKMDQDIDGYSNIIPVQVTKKGTLSKRSSVASIDQFEKLKSYTRQKTEEIGRMIMDGNVGIEPYKTHKEEACKYCGYASICQFDENNGHNAYRVLKELSKEDVWNKIDR
ncbi:helicase-exonuclease AddAB subunit AddB [Vallitalea pronyensis]|uniref:Helicase-exonuclease AddAB subunit AddB n=1 Tax=Vallitalea pronyensis TaxID=1348613 RepID=A0A8J8MP21_9FIRM|nr:helicase-exonuclease AddAB subunit AddB [Vallitalea pronyensis]QUI24753.1 helicase-exonuclease AddAB subunit AddB [Vallitalea pronyensis]